MVLEATYNISMNLWLYSKYTVNVHYIPLWHDKTTKQLWFKLQYWGYKISASGDLMMGVRPIVFLFQCLGPSPLRLDKRAYTATDVLSSLLYWRLSTRPPPWLSSSLCKHNIGAEWPRIVTRNPIIFSLRGWSRTKNTRDNIAIYINIYHKYHITVSDRSEMMIMT